jgi:hypothetical protein
MPFKEPTPSNNIELDLTNPRPFLEQNAEKFQKLALKITGLNLSVDEIAYTPEVLNAVLAAQAESQLINNDKDNVKLKINNSVDDAVKKLDAALKAIQNSK